LDKNRTLVSDVPRIQLVLRDVLRGGDTTGTTSVVILLLV